MQSSTTSVTQGLPSHRNSSHLSPFFLLSSISYPVISSCYQFLPESIHSLFITSTLPHVPTIPLNPYYPSPTGKACPTFITLPSFPSPFPWNLINAVCHGEEGKGAKVASYGCLGRHAHVGVVTLVGLQVCSVQCRFRCTAMHLGKRSNQVLQSRQIL